MNFDIYLKFINKLTLKKITNFLKIKTSYFISVIFKKPVRYGIPWSISVEPGNYCNLKCVQCPVGLNMLTRPKGFMPIDTYEKIIDQTHKYLLNLFLYFQGEPFMNKNLTEMIRLANKKNIFVSLSTNGHFLNRETSEEIVKAGLDYIIISLDGTDGKTYEQYRRNGDWSRVVQGIINLTQAKRKFNSKLPFIELQFLVLKTNQHQINDFKQLCKQLKADKCSLKTAQIEDFSTAEMFIPDIPKYSRYHKSNGTWHLKKKLKNRCPRLWNSAVITWDGTVVPCCYDKDAKYALGNVNHDRFKDITSGKNFREFASKLLTNRKQIDICTNCNE